MNDRLFSHPNFGREVRIEQYGKEVHLIFKANTIDQADAMCEELLRQLKLGGVNITMMGKPTNIIEEQAYKIG
jgi:hypothetical protein